LMSQPPIQTMHDLMQMMAARARPRFAQPAPTTGTSIYERPKFSDLVKPAAPALVFTAESDKEEAKYVQRMAAQDQALSFAERQQAVSKLMLDSRAKKQGKRAAQAQPDDDGQVQPDDDGQPKPAADDGPAKPADAALGSKRAASPTLEDEAANKIGRKAVAEYQAAQTKAAHVNMLRKFQYVLERIVNNTFATDRDFIEIVLRIDHKACTAGNEKLTDRIANHVIASHTGAATWAYPAWILTFGAKNVAIDQKNWAFATVDTSDEYKNFLMSTLHVHTEFAGPINAIDWADLLA